MKKRLFLMALLLAVGLGGIVYGVLTLSQEQEHAAITAETLSGDPKAAEGLRLNMGIGDWTGRLHWDVSGTSAGETETDFIFDGPRQEGLWWARRGPRTSIYAHADLSESIHQHEYGTDLTELIPTAPKLIQEVSDRTKSGETHRETLRMADYFTTYPMFFSWSVPTPDGQTVYLPPHFLEDTFRFPVLPEETFFVEVTKDDAGNTTDSRVEFTEIPPENQESPHDRRVDGLWGQAMIDVVSCDPVEDCPWVYFVVDARDRAGNRMDYSLTQDGYAVYRIKSALTETETPAPEAVLPLSMEEKPILMQQLPWGDVALILQRGRALELIFLDGDSGSELQRMPLGTKDSDLYPSVELILDGEALGVRWSDGSREELILLERKGGRYEKALTADLTAAEEYVLRTRSDQRKHLRMAYDGEKLAVAMAHGTDCGAVIGVFDREGQLYLGVYSTSLSLLSNRAEFAITDFSVVLP